MAENATEASVVAELAKKSVMQPAAVTVERGTSEKASVLLVPTGQGGFTVHGIKKELDAYRPQPERRKGVAELGSLDSFVAHVNRNKATSSAVFATTGDAPVMLAVYDYHLPGADGESTARNCGHGANYRFPLSSEWTFWKQATERQMDQATFAQFLEDRIGDVLDPASEAAKHPRIVAFVENLNGKLASPRQVLELSRGMTVRSESKATNVKNLANGTGTIAFEEQHTTEDGSVLTVPTGFAIAIPVFAPGAESDAEGRPRQMLDAIAVRLRYRLSQGKILWTVIPYRLDLVLREAVSDAIALVRKSTGLPVFEGSPER